MFGWLNCILVRGMVVIEEVLVIYMMMRGDRWRNFLFKMMIINCEARAGALILLLLLLIACEYILVVFDFALTSWRVRQFFWRDLEFSIEN